MKFMRQQYFVEWFKPSKASIGQFSEEILQWEFQYAQNFREVWNVANFVRQILM